MLVFGEPYETRDGIVIVTVARKGWCGLPDRPVGVYTVRPEGTTWTPAVDQDRQLLIGVCAGFAAALLGSLAVLRRPPWPELTEKVMTAVVEAKRGR